MDRDEMLEALFGELEGYSPNLILNREQPKISDEEIERREKKNAMTAIANFYDTSMLKELVDIYLAVWINKGYLKKGKEYQKKIWPNPSKNLLIEIITEFFTDKETFEKAYADMNEAVKEAFCEIAYHGEADIGELYKKHNILIKNPSKDTKTMYLQEEFRFFRTDYFGKGEQVGKLYLHEGLVQPLRKMVPKPDFAKLIFLNEIQTKYRANYEAEALQSIPVTIELVEAGDIEASSTGRVNKGTIKIVDKYLKIEELYIKPAEPKLENIKKELLVKIIYGLNRVELNKMANPAEIIKQIIRAFLAGKAFAFTNHWGGTSYSINLTKTILHNVKGTNNMTENQSEFFRTFRELLFELKNEGWVSVENLLISALYNGKFAFPYSENAMGGYLYYKYNYGNHYLNERDICDDYVLKPFWKGIFAILSLFGVVEIGYNNLEINEDAPSEDGYASYFNGIEYVKLTELGKYALGMIERYDDGNAVKSGMEITLSENELILSAVGEDLIKKLAIEKTMQMIGENTYKMTFQSLFKDCTTVNEIKNRIDNFKRIVPEKLPQKWENFFKTVNDNFVPIEEKPEMAVFKVKEDKELLKIISGDAEIKKIVFKAENYNLTLERKNISKLKKRLAEFGYFCE